MRTGDGGQEPQVCPDWATLLPDAAEGLLSDAEQRAVDLHVACCPGCARELADAQRGAAWLGLLKGHAPEPPANLLQSILAQTTGAEGAHLTAAPVGTPAELLEGGASYAGEPMAWTARQTSAGSRKGFAGLFADLHQWFQRWFAAGDGYFPALQPRFAMTAAMAFFSVCLTLNLLGFSVRNLSAESLRPAGLQRTVADTGASLVRSFEGIRAVYRVESRVNDWRTASAAQGDSPVNTAR